MKTRKRIPLIISAEMAISRFDMLKLWAAGLGIPQRLFSNERVIASINANDPHGMIEDMRRALYTGTPPFISSENLAEASESLDSPLHQLEVVMIFRQYPLEAPSSTPTRSSSQTIGWASEHEMLDGM